jgi:transcriptional repressor NrdR
MKCPYCASPNSRVVDSRPAEDGAILRRRRHCDTCHLRFSTHERVLEQPLVVVKKDGRREEFNAEKLRGGIVKACNKRSISTDTISRTVFDIEQELRAEFSSEIDVARVGEIVMEKLFDLDQVAYVRFASVYQRFDDVKRFAQILERISRRSRRTHKSNDSPPKAIADRHIKNTVPAIRDQSADTKSV